MGGIRNSFVSAEVNIGEPMRLFGAMKAEANTAAASSINKALA